MGGHVWTKRRDFGARKRRRDAAASRPPRGFIYHGEMKSVYRRPTSVISGFRATALHPPSNRG